MSDDLVERVARAFCAVDGTDPCDVVCDWCLYRAAPVVAVCMEEAAKVCDKLASDPRMYTAERRRGCGQCAAAIRNLIGEK